MAFNYECDFNLQNERLTPITKRQDVRLALLESISEPIQWNRDNFFDEYLEGDSAAVWDAGTSYVRYDRVNYQNKIYEAIEDSLNQLPTVAEYWVQVIGDFRGATERIKYNCQKIMLEYILNRWFSTIFRQPEVGTPSDFYIVDNTRFVPGFSVPETTFRDGIYVSNSIFERANKTKKFVKVSPGYSATSNFTVYYPVVTIPTTTDDEYYQMTGLIDQYKIFGSTADYISY